MILLRRSITALQSGDFDGLTGLTDLDLSDNNINTLPPADIFDGLTALQTLRFFGNRGLTTLPESIFAGLTALTRLELNSNGFTALPADIFAGLDALASLSLGNNDFTTGPGLPAGIFDDVLDTVTSVGNNGFIVDADVRAAHFVCSHPAAAAFSAAANNVNCLLISSAQFDASVADATLDTLTISDGTDTFDLTPPFASDTTAYAVSVTNSVENVVVTVIANFLSVAAVTVNGVALSGSSAESELIPLTAGMSMAIPIIVTAADGTTTMTYTVTVTRLTLLPAALTFSTTTIDPQIYTVGTSVDITLPTATGGNPPLIYTISSLPDGLTLTGNVLSGTPTAVQSSTTHVYTVTDSDSDTDTIDFTIEINPRPDPCDGPQAWTGIVPNCLSPGDTYRILFVTSARNATSTSIAVYNTFVQEQADTVPVDNPLSDPGPFAGITFRALASTASDSARENTRTTGAAGERIFYYLGRKVADDYADLYNGNWDTNEPRGRTGSTFSGAFDLWTGSTDEGGIHASPLGSSTPRLGNGSVTDNPLTAGGDAPDNARLRRLFALSYPLTMLGTQTSPADTAPTFNSAARIDNQVYIINSPITSLTLPAATGGDGPLTYSISPTLPTGLTLSGRTLAGNPTSAEVGITTYTYRASDSDSNTADTDAATLTFTIEFLDALTIPMFSSTATIPAQTYNVGGDIGNVTLPQGYGGDGALTYSINPTLPAGLTLTGRMLTGTPAAATMQAATAYTYRVDDTDGSDTDFSTLQFTIQIDAALPNICDRTAEVRDAILALSSSGDCMSVGDLATITILDLDNMGIATLRSGDFAGLDALTTLNLFNNNLPTLPVDIFADLDALVTLSLTSNLLSSLPVGIFNGLDSLTTLGLNGNTFTANTGLPAGVFDDILDNLGGIATSGSTGFIIGQRVRDAHFVCSRDDADAIVAATSDVSDCLRITSAQFDAYNLTDATLSALTLSDGDLDPVFDSATTTYTVSVANSVTSVTVTPIATNADDATITVNAADVTSGDASDASALTIGTPLDIPIVVTAADGTTTMTYTVTVTRLDIDFTVRALSESITEGETAQFEIMIDSDLSEPAILTWTVSCASDNTGVLTVAAADLQAATACESNTLTAGVDTSTIAISVLTLDDTVREPDFIDGEVLTLEVTVGGNMNSASTRVLDNDTVFVGFANDSIRVEEGSAILDRLLPAISFLLNEPPDASSVSVLLTANGCTPRGSTGVTTGVTYDDFASGQCPGPLTVSLTNTGTVLVTGSSDTILNDTFAEGIESFSFSASLNGTQALPTIPPDAATITLEIEDDADSMLSIFTTDTSTLLEGSEDEVEDGDIPGLPTIDFEVRLPDGVTAAESISARWELECGDVVNSDFATTMLEPLCRENADDEPLDPRFSGVAVIETGATFTTISFTVNPDTERERRESFRVHLLPSEGFVIANSNSVATGTILDNDIALLNIVGPMFVTEGSTAVFTFALDPSRTSPSADVEFSWFIEGCSGNTELGGINSFDFADEICPVGTFALSALTAAADTAGGGITVSVSTIRDVLIEGSETFQLGIDLSGLPILELNSIATTTINDFQEGASVMLDVVNDSINEDEADASFGFRIFFADGLTADEDVTVDWEVTCGNNPGITNFDFDFTNSLCPSGEAIISAGTSGVLTTISISNDSVVERDEEFTLRLLRVRATNSDIFLSPPTEATYTIIDDDSAAVSLLTQPAISEAGGPTARITVSLNMEVDEDVTVNWEMVCDNIPGIAAADFEGFGGECPSGTTTILSNSFSDVILIDIADDDLIEGDETFTLNLTGLAVGPDIDVSLAAAALSADYTINDDDSGIISVTVNEPSTVSESAAPTVTFTVTLTGDSAADRADEDVNVRWSVTCVINPGVTAADFAGPGCPTDLATIPAGMDSDTFTIDIARDDLIEGNEPFTVSLTELPGIGGLGLSISPTQGMTTGSITDGDSGEISLTAITGEILEGETATFRVELGGGVTADENIGVPWSVTCGAGSGITGGDFANPSECPASTVTILAGASSATFAVSTYDDADVEGVENFAVTLSSSLSTNIGGLVTVSDTVAGVDINDNDAVLLVFGNPVPSPVGEDSTVEFPLIFDPLLPSAVTLAWRIEGCSQTRTAGIDRFDFTGDVCPSSGEDMLFVPAGATNATVSVETADDDLLEGSESFRLEIVEMMSSLGTPQALTISNAFSDMVTINDRDTAEIRLEGPSNGEVEEGEIAQFTVTLGSGTGETSVADRDISVRWDIKCNLDGADNSEAADADFIQTGTCGSTGMLTINQGESAFSIDDVPTMDDTDFELDERFVMSLTTAVVIGGSGYDIRISSAEGEQTVLILNNDPQELGFRPSGSSALLATVRTPQRSAPESNEPPNAVKVVPDVLDSPDAPPPPRNVEFPYEPVSVRILGFDGSIQHTDPFYDDSRVCLSITEEARRAVRGRIVSLSLYRFDDTWERLENSELDETDPLKSYICDTVDRFSGDFSRFALGYPAPVERSNLSILLPPTGGVTLSLWVLFGSGLLGLALVVSGGVFGLRRRR